MRSRLICSTNGPRWLIRSGAAISTSDYSLQQFVCAIMAAPAGMNPAKRQTLVRVQPTRTLVVSNARRREETPGRWVHTTPPH